MDLSVANRCSLSTWRWTARCPLRRAIRSNWPCRSPCALPRRPRRQAVMFTMRRTVADGVRMWTGFAAPSRMPPTVMPFAGGDAQRVVGDVRGIDVRHDQQVRVAVGASPGIHGRGSPSTAPQSPRISPSTARSGALLEDECERLAHLHAPTAHPSCRSSNATAGRRSASGRSAALPRRPAASSRRSARRSDRG